MGIITELSANSLEVKRGKKKDKRGDWVTKVYWRKVQTTKKVDGIVQTTTR